MTEAAFAKWVNKSLSTVRLWRRKGIGPRYVKLGERGVGFHPADVEAWMASRTSQPAVAAVPPAAAE
jgi:predicted DNA-binding transcriptional regulator AlpA